MAQVTIPVTRQYLDLDLNFTIHPVKKDINKHKNENSVINSIKNLVLLSYYEKPFQPNIGSNIRKLLFENMDAITASAMQREIELVIRNFEPRARLEYVTVKPDFDNNSFRVEVAFTVLNTSNPVNIKFLLQRLR